MFATATSPCPTRATIASGSKPSGASTTLRPLLNAAQTFFCVKSKLGDDAINRPPVSGNSLRYQATVFSMPAIGTNVGFGRPVEPDVEMTYPKRSPAPSSRHRSVGLSTIGESRMMLSRTITSTARSRVVVLTAHRAPVSAIIASIRSCGYDGSIGPYAAPAFHAANIPTTHSTDLGTINATTSSGPTPAAVNRSATTFA